MNEVYICISHTVLSTTKQEILESFKENLSNYLKKHYESFNIQISNDRRLDSITIYVMNKPRYEGQENEIKQQLINLINKFFRVSNVIVNLNYSSFNANFKPPSVYISSGSQKADSNIQPPQKENSNTASQRAKSESDEFDYEKLSQNYQSEQPRFSFEQAILPLKTREQIEEAIGIIEVEEKVFDEWGLRSIIPIATSALSFYGPPGTGKTMAAEAVAQKMGRKILSATYADIESKFHGEGPKMVKAIFKAAERDNAVLFLDESDSLLSKRLTNVSDGSAQAINSMRSQLLISLEHFRGVVIFATNLVINYDRAFLSRLINIEFTMPDKEMREKIWWKHLKTDKIRIPLGNDINISNISTEYEFCGREIKNAVKNACVAVALSKRNEVMQNDLIKACEKTKAESEKVIIAKDHTNSNTAVLNPEQNSALKAAIQKKLNENNNLD